MKRIHINLGVEDLDASIDFYTTLFGLAPSLVRPDYAKWMLDDPLVNFSLSSCCGKAGINHLGIQAERDEELDEVLLRLQAAGRAGEKEKNVSCCYAISDKAWIDDPQGVRWEAFRTHEQETGPGPKCCA